MHIEPHERRKVLKQATQDLHSEVDALAGGLDLTRRNDYCQFLLASAGPVVGLELALERGGVDALFADWRFRRRRFALALDLHALELAADAVEVRGPMSASELFGVLYVLEGSRLGAQLLLRRVDQSTDQAVLSARHFLRANEPSFWPSYLHTLEDTNVPLDPARMIGAARYTFELFSAAFARYCAPMPPQQRATLPPALA